MKRLVGVVLFILLVFVAPILAAVVVEGGNTDWRTAPRVSAGLAPPAATDAPAVIQVYAARAVNWRGIFGVHTWIATRPAGAHHYTVHHVLGWRARRGGDSVVSSQDTPDRFWFGSPPELVGELRGDAAEDAIPRVIQAIDDYPYRHTYRIWPGPNSNTFTAFVGRAVPELEMNLPVTAIGKDYLGERRLGARTPSGTGWQLSVFGLVGVTAARIEGVELNLLGLSAGIDLMRPALKLPGLGRLGMTPLPALSLDAVTPAAAAP